MLSEILGFLGRGIVATEMIETDLLSEFTSSLDEIIAGTIHVIQTLGGLYDNEIDTSRDLGKIKAFLPRGNINAFKRHVITLSNEVSLFEQH